MITATEMAMVSNNAANNDDYVSRTMEKAEKIIKEAAMKGNRYVCFYDICHSCDEGYTRDKENMIINKLQDNGFKIKEKWQIFGGNQITPYVVW